MRVSSLLAIVLAITPGLTFGQRNPFITGGSAPKPWQGFKLNTKTKVRLNFKNSSVDMILGFLSRYSGVTIVKDPSLKDPITATSPTAVTLDKAFDIVSTVLGLKGYEMAKQGDLLVVRQKQPAQPVFTMPNPGGDNGGGQQQRTELRVYPIKYANASEVARVLNDIFAPTGNQPQNFNNGFGGRNRGGGRGGATFTISAAPGGAAVPQQAIKASSDDFSNSVIVNASQRDQDQVKSIIDQIDKQTEQATTPKVFHLLYANANDLAPIVQNVLVSNAPKGKGGQGNQAVPFQQQFGAALRFGAAAAFGNVVADTHTNSLVVSATKDNLDIVGQVIQDLDKPIEIQDTTFVFQLANAKADIIAQLLQQAFGTRQGVSGAGFNANQNRPGTTNTRPNTTIGSSTRPGGLNLNGQNTNALARPNVNSVSDQELSLALQDPNADSGELMTNISVAQGGGFFQRTLGGQNGAQQGTTQTSRDAQGRLINTRDLSGQVTVIPDINTNSVIVVTAPEYIELLKNVLNQLDKLPEQVVIETIIAEATLDKASQFGLEWKLAQPKVLNNPNKSGVATQGFGLQGSTAASTGFSYTLTGGDLTGFFNALQTDSKFQVLSTPRIFTSNNVQAVINISQSIPYVTSSIQAATTGSISYNYSFENVGIVLTVTPRITSNGYVSMDIDQQANDLVSFTSFNAPIVDQREATTTVSVKDGATVILGGIIRKTVTSKVNKIPILGDIPILGNLFKSTSRDDAKTELLVFLTPHVIHNDKDAEEMKNKTIDELSKETKGQLPPGVRAKTDVKSGKGKPTGTPGGH